MFKEYLGIEFYRNYIGIEKPLDISYRFGSKGKLWYIKENTVHFKESNGNELAFNVKCGDVEYMGKPHLKLPEDLSDEEIKYILCDDEEFNNNSYRIVVDDDCTFADSYIACCHDESDLWQFWDYDSPRLTQEQLNRIYSLHSHPKAKEYIEKGLAVRKDV